MLLEVKLNISNMAYYNSKKLSYKVLKIIFTQKHNKTKCVEEKLENTIHIHVSYPS